MEEFLIPIEKKDGELDAAAAAKTQARLAALQGENDALKAFLSAQIQGGLSSPNQSPFNNAYEQYLAKKYYGDDYLGLRTKQDLNLRSRSINEPIKQLTRITKALHSSDEALKNVAESGIGYGIERKLNRWSGGLKEMDERNASLDNALINFANMNAQVTSRGGNNSNQEREEQRMRLGGDFASSEERANRIAQQRRTLLNYFESEAAALESLGYRLDQNSALMQEYLRQRRKQNYMDAAGGKFDYAEYEQSAADKPAAESAPMGELLRHKRDKH